jgi:LmbE family N-acetylglucosaminyl deacetylase
MPIRLREVRRQRVLVVAPHPDDEVIGVGGTLALHQRAGSAVLALYVTLDRPAADGSIPREGEAARAASLLGFDHRFLRFRDGSLSLQEEPLVHALADYIRTFRPDVIYCPFPGDHHRDHQSTSACVGAAVAHGRYGGEVCCYEIWSSLWPNVGIDITSVADLKRQAIECYASQTAYVPYADGALGLNRFRGIKLGVPYAEALFASDGRDFAELTRTLGVI